MSNVLIGVGLLAVAYLATYPWYGNSKSSSIKTACLSNLKQQAIALAIYAEDGDGRYPDRDAWMDRLLPYTKVDNLFHHPGPDWKSTYGYAFNAKLSRAKGPKNPEMVPLVYDSANPIRNVSDPVTSLPQPGRHDGKNGIAYADGHARSVRP